MKYIKRNKKKEIRSRNEIVKSKQQQAKKMGDRPKNKKKRRRRRTREVHPHPICYDWPTFAAAAAVVVVVTTTTSTIIKSHCSNGGISTYIERELKVSVFHHSVSSSSSSSSSRHTNLSFGSGGGCVFNLFCVLLCAISIEESKPSITLTTPIVSHALSNCHQCLVKKKRKEQLY